MDLKIKLVISFKKQLRTNLFVRFSGNDITPTLSHHEIVTFPFHLRNGLEFTIMF